MIDIISLDVTVIVFLAFAVFAATVLQRMAGQGFGMIAAPIVALAAPDLLPATVLLLGLLVGLSSTVFDFPALDRRELTPGFIGRAVGAIIAALIAIRLRDTEMFTVLVAGLIFLGIALSLSGLRVAITPTSLFSAGIVAGIMGTLTAVGAPPMALLYQHEPQRRAAAMQNAFFLWGMLISVAVLLISGLVGWRHLAIAAILAPAIVPGIAVSHLLAPHVETARIRPWALTLAGLAAISLIAKQLL